MRAVDLDIFLRAASEIWVGGNPYITGYYNPPWLIIILAPLAALPYETARCIWFIISVVLFYKVARKVAASRWDAVAYMVSFPVLASLQQGNIEALVIAGVLLPASLGNIILAIKPQAAIGVIAYNIRRDWKSGIPLVCITALSLWVFGIWPRYLLAASAYVAPWNTAFWWPYSVPFGLWLIWKGIVAKQPLLCAAASVFISPYVGVTSLCVLWLPLLRVRHASMGATMASWVIAFGLLAHRLLYNRA